MLFLSKYKASFPVVGLVLALISFLYIDSPSWAIDPQKYEEFKALENSLDKDQAPSNINPADVVRWKLLSMNLHPDNSVLVRLNLKTEGDFTIYTNHLQFTSKSGYDLMKVIPPETKEITDPITGKIVSVHSSGDFVLYFQGDESFDKEKFPVTIRYVACTVRICLFPYTEELEAPIFLNSEALPAQFKNAPKAALKAAPTDPQKSYTNETLEEKVAELIRFGNLNLFMILLALFFGGLITNLTPCVYPMIPITIRLLSQQTKKPFLAGNAYAFGIVVVYSILGLSVGMTGSLFGQYMANPVVNLLLAMVMFLLGFSMLGFGKWHFLSNLGHKIGIDKPSLKQAFLMGCGAGLVASPCTGPILASILTYTFANKDLSTSTLYIFTYSMGFGLPYVFLGALSGKLAKTKVKPRIQMFVKVFFASVMFALSFYYLRIPFYKAFSTWGDSWKAICILTLLLGLISWRLIWLAQHKHKLHWFLTLPAILLGASLFSGSRWAFEEKTESSPESSIVWYNNEEEALAIAKKQNAPLLIDFWAEWCAACKKMDETTFVDPFFIKEAEKRNIHYLKLDVTQDSPENTKLLEKYKVQGLPTLVIVKPGADHNVVSGYASAARLLNYFNE